MAVAPIIAAAPRGIDDSALGTPVDMHFRPLQGSIGKSLFPNTQIRRMPQSYVSHDAFAVRDSMSLEANLSAWSVVDATLANRTESRYATYRAFQIVGISAIDDQVDTEPAPPEAVFYISKIHWGHAYEAVFEGDRRALNAAVAARFAVASGGVAMFASANSLRLHFTGRGLRPKSSDALLARTQNEILSAYDASGPPTPILVEYRAVPNRMVPPNAAIEFDPAYRLTVRFQNVRVLEDGSWFSTPWILQASCSVGPSSRSPPVVLVRERVNKGDTITTTQTISFVAAKGDTLECLSEGGFNDAIAHGSMAGRAPPVAVGTPGIQPLVIEGHGKASYTINATVQVEALQ